MKRNLIKKAAVCMAAVLCMGSFSPAGLAGVNVYADEISKDVIGQYVTQGYENPEYGFKVQLPDTYVLSARESTDELNTDEDKDVVEKSNEDGAYAYAQMNVADGVEVFTADTDENSITITLQTPGTGYDIWSEEETIAKNAAENNEEDMKNAASDGTEITDFEANWEKFDFLGEKHARVLEKFQINGYPYYSEDIYMRSKDKKYMLLISIAGLDADEVTNAESYFTTME